MSATTFPSDPSILLFIQQNILSGNVACVRFWAQTLAHMSFYRDPLLRG